ncbi:hypothetical protein LUZ60_005632 [Juncus effusus]|nr:hypothetical protein LUZ60_005632 [Juncus effusus]
MDSSTFLLIFFLFLSISTSFSQRPKALVSQVTKDPSSHQYLTKLSQRTPLVSLNLVLDLGGQYIWVDCDKNYVSSTYRPARCRSAECSLAKSVTCGNCSSAPRPGCNTDVCGEFPENPFTNTATGGELATDVVSISSTDGSTAGPVATDPHFLFSCAPTFLLKGLARGVVGMIGLGRTKIAPPEQLAAAFSLQRKFAICLSSTTGALFYGGGPYMVQPGFDLSQSLTYTPLLINPVSTAATFVQGEKSVEYFIGVKSIRVDNKVLKIDQSLLTIDSKGNGGTKISTVNPYTLLESSIYKAILDAFSAGLMSSIKRVKPVPPFTLCLDPTSVPPTLTGPFVPSIHLVLQSENEIWTILGAQSMVSVNGALCLGLLDAGKNPRTSIVIGGPQLENNLLEFDLARSRLGFTSVVVRTTCAAFNFTT